ncbi:MAG TPA: tRNA pseudouridine(38-40) synthase TruA [Candidatus Polarisedimenticolia bacterium]|nr:tRNA pseudouridine(38-40) synthase TruA [Candidatus Polarisedimenticolia bacterium]
MRTLKLWIQYLGTRYHGWQVQPGHPTIQGHLEAALAGILGGAVRVAGAGRTDAGVHARGQVASLTTESRVPLRGVLLGANSALPEDIRILSVEEAPRGFHARHQALSKDYAYRFSSAAVLSPFLAPTVEAVRGTLDVERMRQAALHFMGEHDFSAFCGPESRARGAVRYVTESRLGEEVEGVRVYQVSANGFLQHMVRTIVGTLLQVGRGRVDPGSIPNILASRDRIRAGPTAGARGLTLEKVHYREEV